MRSHAEQPNTDNCSLSHLFALHSSRHCHLVGKHSHLNCSQKGTLSSSAFKTSAVQPGVHRPWCWYHRTTSLHSILFMSIAYKRWEICRLTEMFTYMATFILCGVSLLTVTAISADRLLALLKRMRYRQIVTVKRVHILLLMFWIECVCTSFTFVWNADIFYVVSAILIFLCLTVSTFCYVKILLFLASHQENMRRYHHDQANNAKSAPLNIRRYKKSPSTALWIHFTLIVCFLPLVIIISCNVFLSVKRTPLLLILDMAKPSLCFLNSLLNPILYCWKIREIRQVVKKILRKTSC